jgi:hypothetical protein
MVAPNNEMPGNVTLPVLEDCTYDMNDVLHRNGVDGIYEFDNQVAKILRREVYNSIMDKKLAPFTTVGNSRSLHPRVVELVRLRIKSSVVGARSTNLI